MSASVADLVRRSPQRLSADPGRVVTRMFVPGQESFDHEESHAAAVVRRILSLPEDEVAAVLADVVERFGARHRDLVEVFRRHAEDFVDRLEPDSGLSEARCLLIGATFTSEYAIEGAALCNPSVVAHPDQAGVAPGGLRFAMSVRAVGEGHRSSIGFRTGTIDAGGVVAVDAPSSFAAIGAVGPAPFDAASFSDELLRLGAAQATTEYVLRGLADVFTSHELDAELDRLRRRPAFRHQGGVTLPLLHAVAERSYVAQFPPDGEMSERVLWPATEAERNGVEDARFVRFSDTDGAVRYYATYTAYDGVEISQQLLETVDFTTFASQPMFGSAAANKGLGLFPRRIGGRFAALCRADRTTNAIAFADELHCWEEVHPGQVPERPWELLQLGNCGPPIETEAGWLVLTHGVGPMRTYSIGALLLDLDDPTRVVGQLREPLLVPAPDERDGYVPNVVYSCGGLVHAGTLLLPYGISDAAIGIATVPLPDLLTALVDAG